MEKLIDQIQQMTLNERWEYYQNDILPKINQAIENKKKGITEKEGIKAGIKEAAKIWDCKPEEINHNPDGMSPGLYIPIQVSNDYFTEKTKEEAFERLRTEEGQRVCESFIRRFRKKFPMRLRTLTDELNDIENFISEADKTSTKIAFDKRNDNQSNKYHHEYLRLKYDYYLAEGVPFHSYYSFYSGITNEVYGKYFLFKEWLENEISKLDRPAKEEAKEPQEFKDFFFKGYHSKFIEFLIKEGLIANETHIWIDYSSGYKTSLVCILKNLYPKGYLERDFTVNQIMDFAINTFGIKKISESLIKKTKIDSIDLPIPMAHEM